MIPVTIRLEGFLSYREPVELDFTGFDLACVSGSNGAGKSSLLDAITWVLFGQARRSGEVLINNACDAAEVIFVFDYEGNRFRIQRTNPRGKASMLEFHILTLDGEWKPLTERTTRDTQAQIQAVLRLDYETFVNASFFLQGKADQFTQQRAGDRKRILAGILGLDIWETYRRQTVEFRKRVEAEISVVEGRLTEIENELLEEDERRQVLSRLDVELAQLAKLREVQETNLENARRITAQLEEQNKLVNSLRSQLVEAEANCLDTEKRLQSRREEQSNFLEILTHAGEIEANFQAFKQAQADLEQWEEIAGRFREQEKRRQSPLMEIQAEQVRLEQELKQLREQASIIESESGDQPQLRLEKEELAVDVKSLETRLSAKLETENRLEESRQELANAKAENPLLKNQMHELKERIEQLKSLEGAVCPLCGQPLSENDRRGLIQTLEIEGKEMGDRYRTNQTLMENTGQTVLALEAEIGSFKQIEAEYIRQTRRLDLLTDRLQLIDEKVQHWEINGVVRIKTVNDALEAGTYALEARSMLTEIDEQLKEIGYDAAAHDAIRQKVNDGRTAETEFRSLELAKSASAPLGREINDLETQLATQVQSTEIKRNEFEVAQAALEESVSQAPDLDNAQSELLDVQERENKLRMEYGAAQQRVLVLKDLKERRLQLVDNRDELSREVGRYKQLERAFGKDGVPALLIEQALPQIEARANEILDRLSDGTMTVRFVTQAEYKDRRREDLKETLDIQISDSAGVREYELYSGGEAFRVNFAIRLALSEVLSRRAGARLQTLVIDEGFGSQDAHGRQRLIEAINLIRDDFAKILVITHIDELKDAFPVRIEVSKTSAGSQVIVN